MIGGQEAERLRRLLLAMVIERRNDPDQLSLAETLLERLSEARGGEVMSVGEDVRRRDQVMDSIGLLATLALQADSSSLDEILNELGEVCDAKIDDISIGFMRISENFSLRRELPQRDEIFWDLRAAVDRTIDAPSNEFETR